MNNSRKFGSATSGAYGRFLSWPCKLTLLTVMKCWTYSRFTRFICYVGISYQLPGSFGGERANLLTAHLKVMGLLDSARIM